MSLFTKITSALGNQDLIDKAITMGFSRFDKDGDGYIDKSEVLGVLEAAGLGVTPPASMVDAVFAKAGGADGRVDKAEFGQLVRQLLSMTAQEKKAEEAGTAGASA